MMPSRARSVACDETSTPRRIVRGTRVIRKDYFLHAPGADFHSCGTVSRRPRTGRRAKYRSAADSTVVSAAAGGETRGIVETEKKTVKTHLHAARDCRHRHVGGVGIPVDGRVRGGSGREEVRRWRRRPR